MVTLPTKYYQICTTWTASVYYGSASINIAGLPAWIVGTLDTVNKVVFFEFDTDGVTAGTYTYDLTAFTIVVEVQATCFNTLDACCENSVEVIWLNRQGGWQNMQFDWVRSRELRAGGAQVFKNDLTTYYSDMGTVHNGERLKIDVKTKEEYDYLIGLKYSIQAYANGLPILIDQESFPKYDHLTRVYDIGFSFIYAKELSIQKQ